MPEEPHLGHTAKSFLLWWRGAHRGGNDKRELPGLCTGAEGKPVVSYRVLPVVHLQVCKSCNKVPQCQGWHNQSYFKFPQFCSTVTLSNDTALLLAFRCSLLLHGLHFTWTMQEQPSKNHCIISFEAAQQTFERKLISVSAVSCLWTALL